MNGNGIALRWSPCRAASSATRLKATTTSSLSVAIAVYLISWTITREERFWVSWKPSGGVTNFPSSVNVLMPEHVHLLLSEPKAERPNHPHRQKRLVWATTRQLNVNKKP